MNTGGMEVLRMTRIGVIAEDNSDVEVAKELIGKLKSKKLFCVRHFVGNGCGKLRNKCRAWAEQLRLQGCTVLIFIHDLDRNNLQNLRTKLTNSLNPCPILKHSIVIPVEEIEAWLMCDVAALKKVFSIKKSFKLPNNPESIASPKEKLESLVWVHSGKTRRYLHTVHNVAIAKNMPASCMRKCAAFRQFENFVLTSVE